MTDSEYKSCGYHVKLQFTAEHTRGSMKGITRGDSLHFVCADDARSWVDGVNKNHRRGSVDYKVTEHFIHHL
jgi:hypothetical protein